METLNEEDKKILLSILYVVIGNQKEKARLAEKFESSPEEIESSIFKIIRSNK